MKILITESQLRKMVHPLDVDTDLKSVISVADGRRDVASFTVSGNSKEDVMNIIKIIQDNDLKLLYVQGNVNEHYIVYRQGSENEAMELKKIAEKYGGYFHWKATDDDTRRIGYLLGYPDDDVETHIHNRNQSRNI